MTPDIRERVVFRSIGQGYDSNVTEDLAGRIAVWIGQQVQHADLVLFHCRVQYGVYNLEVVEESAVGGELCFHRRVPRWH
jgi:hypothetical protein